MNVDMNVNSGNVGSVDLKDEASANQVPTSIKMHELAALSVLARVNENEKRHQDAIAYFQRCYQGYPKHSELSLETARRLGYTLTAAGNPLEGGLFLKIAVDGWAHLATVRKDEKGEKKKHGLSKAENILSILALRGLSEAHREAGHYENAKKGYEEVLERFNQIEGYGPEHRRTLSAAHGLAVTLLMMSNTGSTTDFDSSVIVLEEAELLLEQTLAAQEIRLGLSHSDTLKGRFDLIKIKARLKKFDIAFYHLEKVVNEGWCGKWFAEQIEKQMIHGGEFEGMLQFNSELFTKILTKSQKGKY